MSIITTWHIASDSTLWNPLVMKVIMIIRNCNKSCEKNKNILLDMLALNFFTLFFKEGGKDEGL